MKTNKTILIIPLLFFSNLLNADALHVYPAPGFDPDRPDRNVVRGNVQGFPIAFLGPRSYRSLPVEIRPNDGRPVLTTNIYLEDRRHLIPVFFFCEKKTMDQKEESQRNCSPLLLPDYSAHKKKIDPSHAYAYMVDMSSHVVIPGSHEVAQSFIVWNFGNPWNKREFIKYISANGKLAGEADTQWERENFLLPSSVIRNYQHRSFRESSATVVSSYLKQGGRILNPGVHDPDHGKYVFLNRWISDGQTIKLKTLRGQRVPIVYINDQQGPPVLSGVSGSKKIHGLLRMKGTFLLNSDRYADGRIRTPGLDAYCGNSQLYGRFLTEDDVKSGLARGQTKVDWNKQIELYGKPLSEEPM